MYIKDKVICFNLAELKANISLIKTLLRKVKNLSWLFPAPFTQYKFYVQYSHIQLESFYTYPILAIRTREDKVERQKVHHNNMHEMFTQGNHDYCICTGDKLLVAIEGTSHKAEPKFK